MPSCMTWEVAGGQRRESERFTVLKVQGTNMAHRRIETCVSRAIIAGIRQCPGDKGVSLDGGRVLVIMDPA